MPRKHRLCGDFDSINYHYLSAQVRQPSPGTGRAQLSLPVLIPCQISGGVAPAAWAPPGPLSASPSQPGRAQLFQALGPALYLPAQTSAWQAAGPAPAPHPPGGERGAPHPAWSVLREFITSQGTPARRPRCGPRCPASPPASLKLQPSGEKKEEPNHKFRLIKHLLILQQFSRPLRNPPETRRAPVIFCYIIFLVKYFPRRGPQRGSDITVTNQNQCALTY